jgi:hypothetical protein
MMRISESRAGRIWTAILVVLAMLLLPGAAFGWDAATLPKCARVGDRKPPAPWMALSEYPRPPAPDTGWGIHDDPNCMWIAQDVDAFFKELKERHGFSWFKVLACGNNKLEVVKAARRQGVEPVVRLYVERPSPHFPRPGAEEERVRAELKAYVEAGARYFETGNEPNLDIEWSVGEWDKPDRIERLCRQWLRVVPIIKEAGGIPVFYAMTPGTAGQWYADCFETFKKWGKIEEAFAGCAIGAHLGSINHPLDYPFNPQKNLPHATREERFASLARDNTCYLCGELIMHLMDRYLPYPVPILSTEGGTFLNNSADRNYPKVTPELHRDMNLETFRRFNPEHPKYWGDPLFAQMSWIYHTAEGIFVQDSWFRHPDHGDLPITKALETEPRFDRGKTFER